MITLTAIFSVLLAGSLAYCVLVIVASRRYLSVLTPPSRPTQPVSILKPLCGHDEGLEDNLRSFFEQDYREFEVLLALHRADDPAVTVAEKIMHEYKGKVETRLIITGESPVPNAKAHSLKRLVREARHELLVMADSDVRVTPDFLARLTAEFNDPRVGLVSCPYRAVPGRSLWSRLEAVGMNTELLGGVLVARMIEGMRFALGCAVAVRASVLNSMGGFEYLQEYLAEDFVMGHRAAELGHTVLLSSQLIEHRIGSQGIKQNMGHRLRWARSTRRSRPAGYWGQIFTYPLTWALLLWSVEPAAWPAVLLTLVLRGWAAWASAVDVAHDPLTRKQWWLLPAQDVLGFLVWIGGFVGGTVVWRNRACTILRDGRLQVNP
ncbi:MAG TPA: bacteriohopanetetrol glucosamine biosynthesis glycosyltransferase HpnI [Verrucomicrobiae bacterium]|jgi:ceramide glucosyltransferase|nr:bacteriohopanetetrol glucosamine biosynthesis glycosyltransferase HpnI [Verrucomicrobiae bacterium]